MGRWGRRTALGLLFLATGCATPRVGQPPRSLAIQQPEGSLSQEWPRTGGPPPTTAAPAVVETLESQGVSAATIAKERMVAWNVVASSSVNETAHTEDAAPAKRPAGDAVSEQVPPLPGHQAASGLPVRAELPPGHSLSLSDVMFLADAENPNVVLARERINEAYARVDRAEALWLPSIRAGLNYVHHEGNVQDVVGNIVETTKSSLYGGLGAAGGGSGSPAVPGLVAQFHLTDAIFQPRIAQHQAWSRRHGATAVRNDTLRSAAVTYLELLRAEQALAIAEEALVNTAQLVKLTGEYARTGQGLRSDNERMLAEQALREADLFSRTEGVRVASARLAQLLHADSSVRISTGEPMVVPLTLVGDDSASSFVATGLAQRPELAEQRHLVAEAVQRLRREKCAPLVPSVLLGFSYGGQGGGQGSLIGKTDDRWDADAIAFWEIRSLGIGERAARNETSSVARQARYREMSLMDQVAREIIEAHAQTVERERRIDAAKRGIAAAERSFRLNESRIENAQGLPIESLQSVQALAAARLSYLNAVIDYDIAQVELARALGWFNKDTLRHESGDEGP